MLKLVKFFFLVYLDVELTHQGLTHPEVLCLLAIIVVNVLKERFFDTVLLVVASLGLIGYGATLNPLFAVLFAPAASDFVYRKAYWGVPVAVVGTVAFQDGDVALSTLILLLALCCLIAYAMRKAKDKEARDQHSLDEERRLRYELEQTKAKLLQSSREVAAIAEVKERNRIAREIHDSVGHSIAGVLIQLQASHKLFSRDPEKAQTLLQKSIERLADSVVLVRDTVHNIKPRETVGVEYVRAILENFKFCQVEFSTTGDFSTIPTNHLEIVATNLKEALTNAARYSKATLIVVKIEVNERYTRLYIKDNGVGSIKVQDGLGLSGMRERAANLGGTLAVSSQDGFMIVCFLPREPEQRREQA